MAQPISYNNPMGLDGQPAVQSNIDGPNGQQLQTHYFEKRALIEAAKERYFGQLADAIHLPKHYGKTIKRYKYMPLLDDRNVNDQGIDAAGATIVNGNLYGSSRDVGYISSKLPTLTEIGGRVNRVGFTRVSLESNLMKLGFFYEYTKESEDFDSDPRMLSTIYTEAIKGAEQMKEAILQRDLLNAAGVILYPGNATQDSDVTAEGATPTEVDYDTLVRLDQILTENRCPMDTKILTGSANTDTRTIPSARIMFVGPEVAKLLQKIKDYNDFPAFIPVEKYASQTKPMRGEIGSIYRFRIIQVPEMLHWEDKGAAVGNNPGYMEANGKYIIYPMLVIGDDSFNTINFNASSSSKNFVIYNKKPGEQMADLNNPYGEVGFLSIKWYYGFMCNWPERIGLIKTVAPI